jgi:hypothetical protein
MELCEELVKLVMAYSNRQIKDLARWIIEYRKRDDRREADLRLEKKLYINRFHRMADEYETLKPKDRPARSQEIFGYYSSCIKALIPTRHRFGIDELCYAGRWKEASEALSELDREIEASRFELEYERLVTDTEYLIEQLVMIMKAEYAKRLDTTREAMSEFMDPHRAVLERLEANLAEAREGLAKVEASELAADDKAGIVTEVRRRIGEMESMRQREADSLRRMEGNFEEVQKDYLLFSGVIASIEKEKDLIEERRMYSGLLRKLDVETSEMDSVFHELGEKLDRSVGKARESMELLVSAFQGKVVDAIAEQEKVNRILEPEGGAEGQPGSQAGSQPETEPQLPNKDYYEEILRILKRRNR